jgi:hypothetical protein
MKDLIIEEMAGGGVQISIKDGKNMKHINLTKAEFDEIQPRLEKFKRGDVDLNDFIPDQLTPDKDEAKISEFDDENDFIPD